jgi:hypothetical protein
MWRRTASTGSVRDCAQGALSQRRSVGPAEWIISRPIDRSTFGTSTLDGSAVKLEMMIEVTSRRWRTVTLEDVDALAAVIIGL